MLKKNKTTYNVKKGTRATVVTAISIGIAEGLIAAGIVPEEMREVTVVSVVGAITFLVDKFKKHKV